MQCHVYSLFVFVLEKESMWTGGTCSEYEEWPHYARPPLPLLLSPTGTHGVFHILLYTMQNTQKANRYTYLIVYTYTMCCTLNSTTIWKPSRQNMGEAALPKSLVGSEYSSVRLFYLLKPDFSSLVASI